MSSCYFQETLRSNESKSSKYFWIEVRINVLITVHLIWIFVSAYEKGEQIKSAVQVGLPILAVDVPTSLYDAMTKNTIWITDDDAWRNIINSFAPSHSAYAWQVREAVAKRKADGQIFLLLFAVREERVHLLNLV